jgi:hypothetical protein
MKEKPEQRFSGECFCRMEGLFNNFDFGLETDPARRSCQKTCFYQRPKGMSCNLSELSQVTELSPVFPLHNSEF